MLEKLIEYISTQCELFKQENSCLTKEFLDSNELKEKSKVYIQASFTLLYNAPYSLNDMEFEEKYSIALKDVRYSIPTVMSPSLSIRDEYSESWLTQERIRRIGWTNTEIKTYRARYLKYLEKIGRSQSVIKETERSSLEIIKKIGDPENNQNFFIKGLVVGNVQSGKTSNFNAVINSSIDVGYRLIIVLSGLMEDLRRQTQLRTEKEVEGKMIKQGKFIGVGEIEPFGQLGKHPDVNQVILPTSETNDFNRTMQRAQFSLNNTNILICKKNTSVLQNLLLWLKDYLLENNDRHHIPFLIIDDEADNGSLNNLGYRGREFASKINGHIRALLALFHRKTYIGYTASPFANILQDYNAEPENNWLVTDPQNGLDINFEQIGNLFPDNFIELLVPPSNYIGAKHFFETRIEEVTKIEPLLAKPLTDYIECFPERVEVFVDGSLEGVKKYNNKNEFDADIEGVERFGTYQDYKQRTRASRKDDSFPIAIPKSLDEAIKCFVISIAIRLSRRPEMFMSKLFQPHHTMLIHISRFANWQCTTKSLIIEIVKDLEIRLSNDNLYTEDSVYREFERIWNKYFEYAINNIKSYLPDNYEDQYLIKKDFDEVKKYLIAAINGIEVMAVNTKAKDVLNYEDGEKKYIVIGGNKLSRGFTLEGLTINYFLRNTNFADTLLQMGRWFGYRPGYLDCCKLFTTKDAFDKFDLITWTIEEMEEEIRKLAKNKKQPIDYAIKILNHPGVLKITRPAILRNAIIEQWSFEDKLIQTTELMLTKKSIDDSWVNLKDAYAKYADGFKYNGKDAIILNADMQGLTDFIESQNTYTESFEKDAILRFVQRCNELGKLINWTIVIKTTGRSTNKVLSSESGFVTDVTLTQRSTPKGHSIYCDKLLKDNTLKISGKSSNILSSGYDMSYTLSESEVKNASDEFKKNNPDKKTVPERVFRERMKDTDGIMVIYLMDPKDIFNSPELKSKAKTENINMECPVIGFALGIPPLNSGLGEEYLVNMHMSSNNEEEDDDSSDEMEGIDSEL